MTRFAKVAFIALFGLAACGREAGQFTAIQSSPSAEPTLPPLETEPPPSETPQASESPTPEATESGTPAPTTSPIVGENAGINGTVRAGPTCPVERANSPCPERPVSGAEVIAKTTSGETAGTTKADDQGKFSLRLPPGEYEVTAKSSSVTSCETQRVTVYDHQYTPVAISCDTGIR